MQSIYLNLLQVLKLIGLLRHDNEAGQGSQYSDYATGCATEESWYNSRLGWGINISFLQIIHTHSEPSPHLHSVFIGRLFLRVKIGRSMKLIPHFHLLPSLVPIHDSILPYTFLTYVVFNHENFYKTREYSLLLSSVKLY